LKTRESTGRAKGPRVEPFAVGVQGIFNEIIITGDIVSRRERRSYKVPSFAFLAEEVDIKREISVSKQCMR
jgi:hypothetical protein